MSTRDSNSNGGARSYRMTILGCRANHAEARDLESILVARGLRRVTGDGPADLEVIHTCSVTNSAAAKSRHAVRKAFRTHRQAVSDTFRDGDSCDSHDDLGSTERADSVTDGPAVASMPEVIVTGCYASTNPDEAAGMTDDPTRVITQSSAEGSTMAERFTRRVEAWLRRQPSPHDASTPVESIRPSADGGSTGPGEGETTGVDRGILPLPVIEPLPGGSRHVRAELRIQDGCDAHCTFCIIPKIRTTLRSKSVADAVAEARMLVDCGHREVVLTGIFIGAYGHETALRRKQRRRGSHRLAELLDAIAQVPGVERLRISSMEPGDVSEELLDAMVANAPVVVPHLHLPLQSGSDRILRRMNRQYGVADYLAMIDEVNAALTTIPSGDDSSTPLPPAITTDIICGFPGETEDDFAETITVARRVGYMHMHVFPYSERQGTAAARWRSESIPMQERRRRVRRLIDLEEDPVDGFAAAWRARLQGHVLRVIVEQPDRDDPSMMTGRSDHYAMVRMRTDAPRGSMIRVRIDGSDSGVLTGTPVERAISLPVSQ